MRAAQPEGTRGSLKWIQRAVAERWADLEQPILARLPNATLIDWRSPLPEDGWAEYRDRAFLERLDLADLVPALAAFWPTGGPQWDALAVTSRGQRLLVEAKAHVREFCTPASASRAVSLARIEQALVGVASDLGSTRGRFWAELFYQHANRLAHLHFLRRSGVDAYLVLVGFLGDAEMAGPERAETWIASYTLADYTLGLKARHPLSPYIIHAFPEVRQ